MKIQASRGNTIGTQVMKASKSVMSLRKNSAVASEVIPPQG